jgi:general secretion pathway protein A
VWLPWAALAAGIALALGAGWALWRYLPRPAKPAAPAARIVPAAPAIVNQPPPTPIERPSLDQLLERYGSETDTDNAFNKLFALWGLEYRAGETDACSQAAAAGLGCLSERGSLAQLRLYNRPAILTVTDAAGATHQVVLAALTAGRAAVSIGGERREIPLDDLGRMWFGDFVMLWQPGSADAKPLTLGMRGAEVQRLRDRLEKISGSKTASRVRGVFDQELQSLVQEFQRSNRLEVDGVANIPTLVVLDSALAANGTPLLDAGSAKGG